MLYKMKKVEWNFRKTALLGLPLLEKELSKEEEDLIGCSTKKAKDGDHLFSLTSYMPLVYDGGGDGGEKQAPRSYTSMVLVGFTRNLGSAYGVENCFRMGL